MEKSMDVLPVSVVIPAFNEEARIGQTLEALCARNSFKEIIVVDDGSKDRTYSLAKRWTNQVIKLPRNQGKAAAVKRGSLLAQQPILLFLDADLGKTASWGIDLVQPVLNGEADMAVAALPPAQKGGFGLVKRMARNEIYKRTGHIFSAPLSGQRAIKREIFLNCYKGDFRFGLEVGLTLDCLEQGYTIQEVELPFSHRETGKNFMGFWHRLKQGVAVYQALKRRVT